MACTEKTSSATVNPRAVFATTHWSVVLSAADSDTHHARDALARLCQSYWYPHRLPENPSGVKIRYKLVQSGQPTPPIKPAAQKLSFGPVQERVINRQIPTGVR